METVTKRERSSLRDLAYIFFRRKWIIIGVLLATAVPTIVYTLRIPTVYEAKSRLLVKPGRENIYVSPVGAPEGTHPPTIVTRVAEIINNEIQILTSRILMKEVIEEIGVARLFPPGIAGEGSPEDRESSIPLENAVNRVLADLVAERVQDSDVLEVGFKSKDPKVAADFVSILVDRYLGRHVEVHQSARSYDFFKAQSNQLEQKLKAAARELAEYKKKYSIVSFDELKNLNLDSYMGVLGKKQNIEISTKTTQDRVEKLKEQLAGLSERQYSTQEENVDPPAINDLKVKLADLELKKADLSSRFKPTSYDIVRTEEAIAKIRSMLEQEEEGFHGFVTTALNSSYQQIESEILRQETELKAFQREQIEVEKQLIEYAEELERLSRLEPQLRALERAVSVHEQNYKLYLTKFEESRVSDAMDAAKMVSVGILEPVTVPSKPVPVNRTIKILVSLCLGGLAGFSLAFLMEYFDHSFKVPDDVERELDVDLLGSIEDLPEEEKQDLKALAVSPQPQPRYQTVKNNLIIRARERGMKVLVFSSPTPGEGCSTVALNIAACLAKDGEGRVLLADANLRDPFLHRSLDFPISPGFSDILTEGADVQRAVKQTPISNLFILSSGVLPANPTVTFESARLAELIGDLAKDFDWVIFDSAPVNLYSDAALLSARTDGVIMVVEAENKRAEVAIRAKEQLEEAGGRVLGAVLNRRRYIIPDFVYRRL